VCGGLARSRGLLVAGSNGIGKSSFALYFLARLFFERKQLGLDDNFVVRVYLSDLTVTDVRFASKDCVPVKIFSAGALMSVVDDLPSVSAERYLQYPLGDFAVRTSTPGVFMRTETLRNVSSWTRFVAPPWSVDALFQVFQTSFKGRESDLRNLITIFGGCIRTIAAAVQYRDQQLPAVERHPDFDAAVVETAKLLDLSEFLEGDMSKFLLWHIQDARSKFQAMGGIPLLMHEGRGAAVFHVFPSDDYSSFQTRFSSAFFSYFISHIARTTDSDFNLIISRAFGGPFLGYLFEDLIHRRLSSCRENFPLHVAVPAEAVGHRVTTAPVASIGVRLPNAKLPHLELPEFPVQIIWGINDIHLMSTERCRFAVPYSPSFPCIDSMMFLSGEYW
jgi:hypothetical protein